MLKCVAIDPGHGGPDPGNVNGGLIEKDVVWPIANITKALIEYHGFQCVMTRNEDEDPAFSVRNRRVVSAGATLVVLIHADSAEDDKAAGTRVYHWPENKEMESMSRCILRAIPYELYTGNASPRAAIKEKYPRPRNIIGAYTYPSVLVETGFLTNVDNRNALLDKTVQQRLALAICSGVLSYTSNDWARRRP